MKKGTVWAQENPVWDCCMGETKLKSIPQDSAEQEQQDFIAQLADRYHAPLLTYFMRRVSVKADAEDLTQETFLRIARRKDASDIKNAEAFLFQTAVNLLRDRARREKTRFDNYIELAERQKSAEVLSPERVVLGREALQLVLASLGQLSEKTRDVFLLHRLEHMKYREIAELYGISQSAVEKHMIKALAHLAKAMDKK